MKLSSIPHLVKEWHPTKNGDLIPEDFTHGSGKKVWFLCPKNHNYLTRIQYRTDKKNPTGCPYCSGKKICKDNNLQFLFPEIAKEWHPTKNEALSPKELTPGTNKKVWWLCPKGHSYDASVNNRTTKINPTSCSYCAGKKIGEDNNLEFLLPEIAKEWHPTKNGKLTAKNISPGSHKKVWWLCSKGHHYDLSVGVRTRERNLGCPYCSGKRISLDNNLQFLFPEIAKEWHPTKNNELKPNQVFSRSSKKVWWLCSKGHSYKSVIAPRTRVNSAGCPICSGHKIDDKNNLLVLFPEIANEWHPTKNNGLIPSEIHSRSHKKVWWLCSKGHSFNSNINNRTGDRKKGCPYCSNRLPSESNNLEILFPEIAKEWHPTKNNELSSKGFSRGSSKKVWWLCSKGHSYNSVISSRTKKINPTGCPYCSNRLPSETNNLESLFPEIAKDWHPTKNKGASPKNFTYGTAKKVWWLCSKGHSYEAAILSRTSQRSGCPKCSNQSSKPEIRILSELNWFFDEVISRYKIDSVEIDIFIPSINLGIEYDGFHWHKDKEDKDLKKNIFALSKNINLIRVREEPLKYLSENDIKVSSDFFNKNDFDKILKKISPFIDKNLRKKINIYFDKENFVNEDLFKEYLSYFPSPFPQNSLLKTHPLISSEWDYDKNQPLKPENFSYGSAVKIWWLCPKKHSYESAIKSRAGSQTRGCPYCSGNKVGKDNNLQFLFPEIAKEWHPTKNNELSPKGFSRGSSKKVWWLCPKGHSYESVINSRTGKRKQGCPYCSGNRALNLDLFK